MPLVRQGGDPNAGKVMTTMGPREPRPPVCPICRERRPGMYTVGVNGQVICSICAGSAAEGVLTDDVSQPSTSRD